MRDVFSFCPTPRAVAHCHSEKSEESDTERLPCHSERPAKNMLQNAFPVILSVQRRICYRTPSLSFCFCHSERQRRIWRRRAGQRTTNKINSYLVKRQVVTKIGCSWSPRKSGDREQGYFTLHCVSTNYKNQMFAVRCSILKKFTKRGRNILLLTAPEI